MDDVLLNRMHLSGFNLQMKQFMADADKHQFLNFEFIVEPSYNSKWLVQYHHKPKNFLSKAFHQVYKNPRHEFTIEVRFQNYSKDGGEDVLLTFVADGYHVILTNGPYTQDPREFFKDLRHSLFMEEMK